MTQRNPLAVAVFTFISFGIYGLYWLVVTKGEMVKNGAQIPTAWLLIVPFANIYWLWKWSEAVEPNTGGKIQGILAFVLVWLLGFIGMAIIQDGFNKNSGSQPAAPAAGPTPPAEQPPAQPPAQPPVQQ